MSKGGGQGSFAQMQEPGLDMGGFGGPPQPAVAAAPSFAYSVDDQNFGNIQEARQYAFDTYGNLDSVRAYKPPAVEQPTPIPPPTMVTNQETQGPESFTGGFGSKGGRSNPYQTDGIVPPTMRGQPLPGRRQFFDPINQPIARPDPAPRRTSRFTDAEHSAAEAQAREILGLPPKGGGRVYAGGTPNFDERTGEYRTGGIKPPRGPARLEPIKMQPMPMPFEPVLSDGPDFRPPPEDIESRGTVGPGGGTRGRTGSFRDAIREFRDEFRYQPMPRREPPVFFPTPMPRPRPPRMPPRMPGRNTQFQMPFFGSPYGQMNPYAGQFSGYGVPSNMFSFAQPHYQPYVPQAYTPPPPVMQLPPDQGNQAFSGGFGGQGIGGFGRYNLGLARRQFGGR